MYAHFLLSGFSYDFITNNVVMELSFKCLKDGGKYLARVSCSGSLFLAVSVISFSFSVFLVDSTELSVLGRYM